MRRFSSAEPSISMGQPLPIELRAMVKAGFSGPPEHLDDDELWEFAGECGAPQVAAELSIDPVWTGWPTELEVDGHPLIAWPEADDDVSIFRGCYVFEV